MSQPFTLAVKAFTPPDFGGDSPVCFFLDVDDALLAHIQRVRAAIAANDIISAAIRVSAFVAPIEDAIDADAFDALECALDDADAVVTAVPEDCRCTRVDGVTLVVTSDSASLSATNHYSDTHYSSATIGPEDLTHPANLPQLAYNPEWFGTQEPA
ncbi:MAG TPA: hypothetical protein VFQ88_15215 [Nevskiaceae bacterium]|nr:hypothetical protein [Nevskiaceae bacterium]